MCATKRDWIVMRPAIRSRWMRALAEHAVGRKEAPDHMVPLLLWILGVPGLIIILLLLFGVIHL
jgi:hypothetical protein